MAAWWGEIIGCGLYEFASVWSVSPKRLKVLVAGLLVLYLFPSNRGDFAKSLNFGFVLSWEQLMAELLTPKPRA
jgi:hypothetical protein